MKDVQNSPAGIPLHINRVGIRDISMPLLLRCRETGPNGDVQRSVASIDISVDLPPAFKGTHMSRFVEGLQNWAEISDALDYQALKQLLIDTCQRLNAQRAHVVFRFPYFLQRKAPASGRAALMPYQCAITGELLYAEKDPRPDFNLEVVIPVMTVCPCSKAISDEGAHSQRADVRISVSMKGRIWIEELIEIAEESASSPVYTLLKREDEKYVTEHAFANPCFVEDVVRAVAMRVSRHPLVTSFSIDVESHESIHAHNAFAHIEGKNARQ
ncbi:MAG: GTP cyclohydrolase I FolE2 [Desulfovibrionaceae bacterium]|nr:GTP cyclohydrolase I FolE2 [Desulfovibrionaceae bacterium]